MYKREVSAVDPTNLPQPIKPRLSITKVAAAVEKHLNTLPRGKVSRIEQYKLVLRGFLESDVPRSFLDMQVNRIFGNESK